MSDPSFSNIDQWLFELEEGNLSPSQVEKLEAFLLRHPELDVDRDVWHLAKVDTATVPYPHKKQLERRRPVALYWNLATAASIALIIGMGIYSYLYFASLGSDLEVSLLTGKAAGTIPEVHIPLTGKTHETTSNDFISSHQTNAEWQDGHPFSHSRSAMNGSTSVSPLALRNAVGFDYLSSEPLAFRRTLPETSVTAQFHAIAKKSARSQTNKSSGIKHKHSFEYRFKQFKRSIRRMVDNPIALKNLKDPHYHVPGLQATDVNFSSVGTLLATRVQVASRYQWMGEHYDQLMNQILVDGYSYGMRGGIGLQVYQSAYNDNGIMNTSAALTYSPKFSVSNNVVVEPGIRFKMGNTSINPSKLTPNQPVEFERGNLREPQFPDSLTSRSSLWYKDLGASILVNTKWFYVGAQVDNLARHTNNIYGAGNTERADLHTILTIGTDYESKNEKLSFSPYLIYQKYGDLSEAWLGANFRANWFTVGAGVSSKFEPAASIGVKFEHFALTYNADYTQSMIQNRSELSHQLTIRFLTNPSRIGQRLLNL